jgi:hypothetical protein
VEANPVTCGQFRPEILQTPIDLERDATRGHLQTLSLALAIERAVLLEYADAQPDQHGGRQERGGCEEYRKAARVHPGHGGIISELRELVTSCLRHETTIRPAYLADRCVY